MEKSSRCTIIVSSCDSYDDLWEPFFKLFTITWPDCPYSIVLNTESKSFTYPGLEIRAMSHYEPGEKVAWGKRLRYHLSQIETEYVITMLDDFFLSAPPDNAYLEKLMDYMDTDKSVAVFSFGECKDSNNKTFEPFPDFYLRPAHGPYKYNCQTGIWRTKELYKSIKPFESPWDWELRGNIRSFDDGKKYLTLKDANKTNIVQYGFVYGSAWGVCRGKWVLSNVEPVFRANGIDIDYTKRGLYTEDNNDSTTQIEYRGLKELKRKWSVLCDLWHLLRSLEFKRKYISYYPGGRSYRHLLGKYLRRLKAPAK